MFLWEFFLQRVPNKCNIRPLAYWVSRHQPVPRAKMFWIQNMKIEFFNFEVCKIDEYLFTKFLENIRNWLDFHGFEQKIIKISSILLSMFSSTTTSVEWRCTSKSSLAGTPSGSSPGFPARIGPKRQKLITKIQKCLNFNEIDVFLDENSNL